MRHGIAQKYVELQHLEATRSESVHMIGKKATGKKRCTTKAKAKAKVNEMHVTKEL